MKQQVETLTVNTGGRGLVDIAASVLGFVAAGGIATGLLTIWCRHSSASLLVQENADPEVRADLETFFARLAPEAPGRYRHDAEGPDDMPAHIRAALTQSGLSIPVVRGRPVLGNLAGDLSLGASPGAASARVGAASDRQLIGGKEASMGLRPKPRQGPSPWTS